VRTGGRADRARRGLGALALAYAAAGDGAEAAAVGRELEARAGREYVAPTRLAQASLTLGDTTATLMWLERAADARDPWLIIDVCRTHFGILCAPTRASRGSVRAWGSRRDREREPDQAARHFAESGGEFTRPIRNR